MPENSTHWLPDTTPETDLGNKPDEGRAEKVTIPQENLASAHKETDSARGKKPEKSTECPDPTTSPEQEKVTKSTNMAPNTTPETKKENLRAEKVGKSISVKRETLSNQKINDNFSEINLDIEVKKSARKLPIWMTSLREKLLYEEKLRKLQKVRDIIPHEPKSPPKPGDIVSTSVSTYPTASPKPKPRPKPEDIRQWGVFPQRSYVDSEIKETTGQVKTSPPRQLSLNEVFEKISGRGGVLPQEMLSFVDSEDYQIGRPGGGKPQQHLSFVDIGKSFELKDLKNTPSEVEILRKKFENETQDDCFSAKRKLKHRNILKKNVARKPSTPTTPSKVQTPRKSTKKIQPAGRVRKLAELYESKSGNLITTPLPAHCDRKFGVQGTGFAGNLEKGKLFGNVSKLVKGNSTGRGQSLTNFNLCSAGSRLGREERDQWERAALTGPRQGTDRLRTEGADWPGGLRCEDSPPITAVRTSPTQARGPDQLQGGQSHSSYQFEKVQ